MREFFFDGGGQGFVISIAKASKIERHQNSLYVVIVVWTDE